MADDFSATVPSTAMTLSAAPVSAPGLSWRAPARLENAAGAASPVIEMVPAQRPRQKRKAPVPKRRLRAGRTWRTKGRGKPARPPRKRTAAQRQQKRMAGWMFGSTTGRPTELKRAAKKGGGQASLSIGGSMFAVLLGVGTGVAIDSAFKTYVTSSRPVRLLVGVGVSLLIWFIGGSHQLYGQFLKLFSLSNAATGIILLGWETAQVVSAANTSATAPAVGGGK